MRSCGVIEEQATRQLRIKAAPHLRTSAPRQKKQLRTSAPPRLGKKHFNIIIVENILSIQAYSGKYFTKRGILTVIMENILLKFSNQEMPQFTNKHVFL